MEYALTHVWSGRKKYIALANRFDRLLIKNHSPFIVSEQVVRSFICLCCGHYKRHQTSPPSPRVTSSIYCRHGFRDWTDGRQSPQYSAGSRYMQYRILNEFHCFQLRKSNRIVYGFKSWNLLINEARHLMMSFQSWIKTTSVLLGLVLCVCVILCNIISTHITHHGDRWRRACWCPKRWMRAIYMYVINSDMFLTLSSRWSALGRVLLFAYLMDIVGWSCFAETQHNTQFTTHEL